MEKRVAMICIIIEEGGDVEAINALLHEYSAYIIGRMGLPYPARHISMISIMIDAPQDTIAALSGRIGALAYVSSKTLYSHVLGV